MCGGGIGTVIFNHSEDLKSKDALVDDQGYSLTYGELVKFSEEMEKRIPKRTLVFLLCTNSVASLAAYVAFCENGIVPLMLNAGIEKGLREKLVEVYCPEYIFVPSRIKHEFSLCSCIWEYNEYSLLKTNFNCDYELFSELEVLLSTSGSTGTPKFVRIGHKNFRDNVEDLVQNCSFATDERYITMLPMAQVYGLSRIRCHLALGNTILLTDKSLFDESFWEFFRTQKASTFGAVPYMYEMLDKIGFYSFELPYLRYMSIAGGKVSKALKNRICSYVKEKGIKFDMYYGSTEVCGAAGYLFFHEQVESLGDNCIGKPMSRMKWIIRNGENSSEEKKAGELQLIGDSCALGYAMSNKDLVKGDEWGHIYNTGDMVCQGEDELYYMLGRSKRFEKIYGNRINLDEIEVIVQEYLNTLDCVCVGKEDELHIFVTPCYFERVKEIKKLLSTRVKIHSSVLFVDLVEEIPRTTTGKVAYGELLKRI